jgi:hypothetical protein
MGEANTDIFCNNCGTIISEEWRRQSKGKLRTCSKECSLELRTKLRQRKRANTGTFACVRCGRPATPAEWASYRAWRNSEAAKTLDPAIEVCPTCFRKKTGRKKSVAIAEPA